MWARCEKPQPRQTARRTAGKRIYDREEQCSEEAESADSRRQVTSQNERCRKKSRTGTDRDRRGEMQSLRRMAQSRASGGRLSVDYCIQAGYALPADDGLEALKVDRLCTRLGVTKGSFYWHFKDMAGYRARARAGVG